MNSSPQPQGPEPHQLEATTLEEIADEIHHAELAQQLTELHTNEGKNYAIYKEDWTPETGVVIIEAAADGPDGSTKICDGTLTIDDDEIEVTAFRLA